MEKVNLFWTRTEPTEPGWYFVRGVEKISFVMHAPSGILKRSLAQQADAMRYYGSPLMPPYEYAGPIPEPQEIQNPT